MPKFNQGVMATSTGYKQLCLGCLPLYINVSLGFRTCLARGSNTVDKGIRLNQLQVKHF